MLPSPLSSTAALPHRTEVLVAGAGPAGLSLAVELGLNGRDCLVVECQERGGLAPRAKTTNVRTRELMRRWGIADELAAQSPFGVNYASDVVFATALLGRELARFPNAMACSPVRDDRYSEHAQWIPQNRVEQVLREAALRNPGVRLLQPVRLHSFTQDAEGILATLEREDGIRWQVRARYLVGADGARSTVRKQLDIPMKGTTPLGHHRSHVFRSPGLAQRHKLGEGSMYWMVNDRVPSVLAALDQGDLWTFGCQIATAEGDPAALIRAVVGADIPVEVISRDDWTAHELIAARYRVGRAFLIGDACHLHPPFGGHGMNMGVGDAVDLGWKLNAVLAGWAGPGLLESYEIERRQVHRRVVDESKANHRLLAGSFHMPGLDDAGPQADQLRAQVRERILAAKAPEFYSLGLVLGYHYEDSPTLMRESIDEPPHLPTPNYMPSARPGCRAPHAWLAEGRSRGASLFDQFDRSGFTLLCTANDAQADAARRIVCEDAASWGIPLAWISPHAKGLREAYGARYALIRPDQHVAWRGNDPARALVALQLASARGSRHPDTLHPHHQEAIS